MGASADAILFYGIILDEEFCDDDYIDKETRTKLEKLGVTLCGTSWRNYLSIKETEFRIDCNELREIPNIDIDKKDCANKLRKACRIIDHKFSEKNVKVWLAGEYHE